jgi:glycosyltransferase involved in cell wall biosynthesis
LPQVLCLVIIPAYNEEKTIGNVIEEVRKEAPFADIAVVDDGSADRTRAIAKETGVTVLAHPFNMGVGAAMQTGFRYAVSKGYDIAVQVDADGQHPAAEIRRLVTPIIEKKADLVVGSRFLGEPTYRAGLARAAGIALFSRFISAILKENLTDTTSGFRATGKRALEFLARNYPDDYPEVEALVLLHKKKFVILEVPVTMRERMGGRSSITPLRSVYYMIKVTLAIVVDLIKKAQ